MKDCFFGLLRSYVRVDKVVVRVLDTKIFHDYKTDEILRSFEYKEASYEELLAKGFKFNAKFNNDRMQSFTVYNLLEDKFKINDVINF